MNIKRIFNRESMVIILPVIILILFTFIVFSGHMVSFEDFIYNKVIYFMSPMFTDIVKTITQFGDTIIISMICILLLTLNKTRLKYGVPVAITVVITAIINLILKNIFMRQRPNILNLVVETSYSFPSGHAMATSALYVMLIYLICYHLKNQKIKVLIAILFSLFIVVIGISRVYLGVHFITDVIAGWILGFVISTIIYYIWRNKILLNKKHELIEE